MFVSGGGTCGLRESCREFLLQPTCHRQIFSLEQLLLIYFSNRESVVVLADRSILALT